MVPVYQIIIITVVLIAVFRISNWSDAVLERYRAQTRKLYPAPAEQAHAEIAPELDPVVQKYEQTKTSDMPSIHEGAGFPL